MKILTALLLPLVATTALAQAISPDGSTLLDTASGSLLTNAGTWTFGAAAAGGDVILLNGVSTQGTATEMAVATSGTLYSYSAGIWYTWNGNSFCCASTTAPAGISTPPPAPPAATYSVPLTWVAPTQNTDGSAITGTLAYNVYQGTNSSSAPTEIQTGVSGLTATVSGLAAGSYCFTATAVVNGVESVQAMPFACVTVPVAGTKTPNPPSSVTIGTVTSP